MRTPIAAFVTLLSLGLFAAPAFADDGDTTAKERRADRRARILEQFDSDGDGKLGADERDAARAAKRAEIIQKYDANGDGALDEEERKAARSQRRAERGDAEGARRPRRVRRQRARERMRRGRRAARMLDRNGDGQFDEAERASAREAFEKRLAKFGDRLAKRAERGAADGDTGRVRDGSERDGRRRMRRGRMRRMFRMR